jgi:putative drug exporter of the RND superfamily
MRKLAQFCIDHRGLVVAGWIVLLLAVTAISRIVGNSYSNFDYGLPNSDTTHAQTLLTEGSPKLAGDTELVAFSALHGTSVNDPQVRTPVTSMLQRLASVPHVTSVVSPYSPGGDGQISKGGTIAFATVTFDQPTASISLSTARQLVNTARSGDGPDVTVAVGGQAAEQTVPQYLGNVGIGIAVAAIVLLIVFGSLLAMILPLISAILALGTGVGMIAIVSHGLVIAPNIVAFVLLVGLGVGVDYALFVVTRYRRELLAGQSVSDSIVTAMATSGRAVLFAGITVCVSILGMFALGMSFFYGLAVSSALSVALTMIAALTVLPALLSLFGTRVLSRRQRASAAQARSAGVSGASAARQGSSAWSRWTRVLSRGPVAVGGAALIAVVLLGVPFLSMRLAFSDQGNDPQATTTRQAYDLLANGFGAGFNGPLLVVAQVNDQQQRATFSRLASAIAHHSDVAAVVSPQFSATAGQAVATLTVYPAASPQSAATTELVDQLRATTVPGVTAGTGLRVYIGGETASFIDFSNAVTSKLAVFLGVIVGLSLLILAVVFRSVVIPLISAAMNILSIAAAFGALVAVFQWGWLGSLFGVGPGPIEVWLPALAFAVLFGISTDYQVFLVSHVQEEWQKSGDARAAVRRGLAVAGPIFTSAALIMIFVYGSFILGGERQIKEFGLVLAGGVLVDALVVRTTVVPALMLLLGKASWWRPGHPTAPGRDWQVDDAPPVSRALADRTDEA